MCPVVLPTVQMTRASINTGRRPKAWLRDAQRSNTTVQASKHDFPAQKASVCPLPWLPPMAGDIACPLLCQPISTFEGEVKPERTSRATGRDVASKAAARSGRPHCPGQQFALLETSLILARFLQEYSRLETPTAAQQQQPWTENYTLTCSVGQGSWAKLTKRRG
ncbi:hypothetical protein N658DRAFT_508066 [Parathielavia hyrcaniae]|uniref:Uncharacterized protein n=1 Tax=Parathielavia hyrcaniae TaxID=113614 RepID=A0AAN6PY48_9PEZI|nr:hypothetical protein N658DRAFT_508066 [Parathielavia hyrcaniae]